MGDIFFDFVFFNLKVKYNNLYNVGLVFLNMLIKKEPDLSVLTDVYSAVGVTPDKRCRGDNPVIGKIERGLGKVCKFSNLCINPRDLSESEEFFYKFCYAKMFSQTSCGVFPVQLSLKGKYLFDDVSADELIDSFGYDKCKDLGKFVGEVELQLEFGYDKCKDLGKFVGEVELQLEYNNKMDLYNVLYDIDMIKDVIISSGLNSGKL